MIKKFTQLFLFALLSILLIACGDETDKVTSATSEKIVVNIANLGYSTLNVAKEAGYLEEEFAKHNATFEYSIHQAGPPINEGIASKRIDLGVLGEGAVLGGANNNLDTKLISLASDGLTGINSIIATKDSGVTKLEDLKGKKIAVNFGTSHQVFLLKVLNEVGLSVEDVNLVNLTITDAHPAFQTNQVDAWVTADLYANIEAANGAELLANGETFSLYSPTFYIARGEFAKEHPELVEAYLRAIDRAIELKKTDNEKYLQLAAKAANQEIESIKATDTTVLTNEKASDDLIEQFQDSTGILQELEYITKDVNIKSLIDTTYIDNVRK